MRFLPFGFFSKQPSAFTSALLLQTSRHHAEEYNSCSLRHAPPSVSPASLHLITTIEEAKKLYPLFGLGANVALIFSSRTVKYLSNMRKNFGPGVDGWAISLKAMMSIVVVMGLAICGLY